MIWKTSMTSSGPSALSTWSALATLMPKEHRKAMDAILKCRTEEAGIALYECEDCGHPHIVYRSCGNRHCPTCQHHKTREWLETQINRQLPGHHFMLTFTVPESLRRFIRATRGSPTRLSSKPLPKPSKSSLPMTSISGAIFPASSGCFTPGDAPSSTIPISTTLPPEGLFRPKTGPGIPRE